MPRGSPSYDFCCYKKNQIMVAPIYCSNSEPLDEVANFLIQDKHRPVQYSLFSQRFEDLGRILGIDRVNVDEKNHICSQLSAVRSADQKLGALVRLCLGTTIVTPLTISIFTTSSPITQNRFPLSLHTRLNQIRCLLGNTINRHLRMSTM